MSENNTTATTQTDDILLITGYSPFAKYLDRVQTIYKRAKDDFFKLRADDSALLEAAERWRLAAVSLIRMADRYYRCEDTSQEEREQALKIMNIVTKDSATRSENISRYYDILAGKDPDNVSELLKAEKADHQHLDVLGRMMDTRNKYIKWYKEDPNMESLELRVERKTSKRIFETH